MFKKILKGYLPWARLGDYYFLKPKKLNSYNFKELSIVSKKVFYLFFIYSILNFILIILSVYLNNKALPTSSYWSIKDLDTEEIVVDYDTTYTKISCDTSGSYFDVYMNGLQPERYYKLLFKTVLATGGTVISDNNYYFKVIR